MEHTKTLLTLAIAAMVLTGFCVASVAAPAPVVVICGVELTLKTGIAIAGVLGLAIKEDLDLEHHQAELHEFLQKVSEEFTSWLSSLKKWVNGDSNNAQKLFEIDNVLYSHAPNGPDGNKTKWLKVCHEARVTKDGKNVEIKKGTITKDHAMKLEKNMKKDEKRGIFLPNQEAAVDLYKSITGKNPPKHPDLHQGGRKGQYPHYHTNDAHTSHLWWPKK